MKGGKRHQGYTIVEVMIVLAVSGVMFIIAANFVSGKQARTAFTQGVNTLAADIQSSIESVVDGEYTDIPLNCNAGSNPMTFTSAGSTTQGTNSACIFLGTLLHFNATNGQSSDIASNYDVLALAGSKTDPILGGPLTMLSHSYLTAITTPHSTAASDLTRSHTTPQALDVNGMDITFFDGTGGTGVYNIGFVQGLGSQTTAPGSYDSGAQTISMIGDPGIGTLPSSAAAISQTSVHTASKAIICLTDGTRFAHITIGDNGNQLKATVQLGDASKVCT